MSEPGLPIRAVSQITGLSQHAIRAWERRYGIVEPDRTGTNRRLYSRGDVERLLLLKKAGEQGHSLAQVADLPLESMRRLVGEGEILQAGTSSGLADSAIRATHELDAVGLEGHLEHALVCLGIDGVLDQVVIPLIESIDQGWVKGTTTIAQEHLASSVLRNFLHRARRTLLIGEGARRLVVTTLPGELHELGALIAALVAATKGWHVTYLGPSLPPTEIARAATDGRAKVVAISLVSPRDPEVVGEELEVIRRNIPSATEIVVGGRATDSVGQILDSLGVKTIRRLDQMRDYFAS